MKMNVNEEISMPLLILVGIILLTQSIFLFTDARRNGHNYWLWGIIGLIQAPMPTIFYLAFVRKIWKKDR
ncbi:sigma-Y antisigma factor component [Cytobacillus sp. FJAT-54145]|uniref:Sigma-Y antisigma factor component n=1 Tax=Cytobacillus spartinae TaxID=3299023 RepID=A0ABW6K7J5_9BACI